MKKISLLVILTFSFLLVGCGREKIDNQEIANQEEASVKTENDFSMSDCMKWCELMQNKDADKDQIFKNCSALCEAGKAIDNNDASGCEKSEGMMKDACYSSVAYEKAKPDLCKKINDVALQFGCYASIAEKTKNPDVCDDIKDSMWNESCMQAAKAE